MVMNTKIPLYFLIGVIFVVAVLFIVSTFMPDVDMIQTPTARLLGNVLSMGVMIQSAIFSLLLIRQSEVNKRSSDDRNDRSEAFRNFQFIAENRAKVEFHEFMLMYRTNPRYVDRLKSRLDFKFFMRHNGIEMEDIVKNLDNYSFLTIIMPIKVVDGDLGEIKFINFRLEKENEIHFFVPCSDDYQGLILWNEEKKRYEVTVNLILNKGSGFYNENTITTFTKIKLFHSVHSMLGVVVRGWTELYFTNPQKRERDGANRYMISSSQFKISGIPELETAVQAGFAKRTACCATNNG